MAKEEFINIDVTLDNSSARRSIQELKIEISTCAQTAENTVSAIEQVFSGIEAGAGAIGNIKVIIDSFKALATTIGVSSGVFGLALASVAALGAGIYYLATRTDEATLAQERLNERNKKFNDLQKETQQAINQNISTIRDETQSNLDKVKAYEKLKQLSPELTKAYTLEGIQTMSLGEANKLVNEQQNIEEYEAKIKRVKELETLIGKLSTQMRESKDASTSSFLSNALNRTNEDLRAAKKDLDELDRLRAKAAEQAQPIEVRIKMAENNVAELNSEFEKAKQKLEEAKAKITGNNGFGIIPIQIQFEYNIAQKNLEEGKKKVEGLTQNALSGSLSGLVKRINEEQKKLANLRKEATKDVSKVADVNTQDEFVSSLKTDYKSITGKEFGTDEQQAKEVAEKKRRLANAQKKREEAEVKTNNSAEPNKEATDFSKELKQIEERRDAIIDALEQEKNAYVELEIVKAKAKGKTITKEEVKTDQYDKKIKETNNNAQTATNTIQNAQAEKETLNTLLETYQNFEKKKAAINAKYEDEEKTLKKGGNTDEIVESEKRRQKELSALKLEEGKADNFGKILGNLDDLTLPSMEYLKTKIKDWINGAANGLTPEDLKSVTDAFNKLDLKISEQKSPFKVLKESAMEYSAALKNVKSAEDVVNEALTRKTNSSEEEIQQKEDLIKAEENLAKARTKTATTADKGNQALGAIGGGMSQAVGMAGDVMGIFDDVGLKVPDSVKQAVSGVGQIADGLGSIDLKNPVSIVTGAIKVVGGLVKTVSAFFNGDEKREKEIQRQQENIEKLEASYDALGEKIKEAYSSDASQLIEQQNTLLEQQKAAIKLQIASEEAKKETDQAKIDQWNAQLAALDGQIADNKEKQVDAIFGSDVKSAIDDFASAIAESWSGGTESGANQAKELTKKMIKGIVAELLKGNIAGEVEKLRKKIAGFMGNEGELSEQEIAEIEAETQRIFDSQNKVGKQYDKIFKEDTFSDKESLTGAIRGSVATEQSVSELGGIFRGQWETLIRIEGYSMNLTEMATLNASIAANTLRTANNTDGLVSAVRSLEVKLDNIERNTKQDHARY